MGTTMTSENAVARPLSVLVPLIKEDLAQGKEASERAGLPYYQAAGEKMLEAKGQLKQGEFVPWVQRHLSISQTQAKLYMSYARTTASIQNDARAPFTSLDDFKRRGLGHHRPMNVRPAAWHEPVKEVVDRARRDAERIQEENLSRAQERDEQRKLALRLIDIGYKILSKELHPDKGGSRDAMTRLNQVRDRLKGAA